MDNEVSQRLTFKDYKNMGICLIDLIQVVVEMGEYREHREKLIMMARTSRDEDAIELLEDYDKYFKHHSK